MSPSCVWQTHVSVLPGAGPHFAPDGSAEDGRRSTRLWKHTSKITVMTDIILQTLTRGIAVAAMQISRLCPNSLNVSAYIAPAQFCGTGPAPHTGPGPGPAPLRTLYGLPMHELPCENDV